MTNAKVKRDTVLSDEEIEGMFYEADRIWSKNKSYRTRYYSLRAKCLVAIARRTGKRAGELNCILFKDVVFDEYGNIELVFTLEKKRHKEVRLSRSPIKVIQQIDPFAQYIIDYIDFIRDYFQSEPKYLFPSVEDRFGKTFKYYDNRHVNRRTVLRIIKRLDEKAWVHLFRETVGGEVIRKEKDGAVAIFRVAQKLDINPQSAYNYMSRFAKQTMDFEAKASKIQQEGISVPVPDNIMAEYKKMKEEAKKKAEEEIEDKNILTHGHTDEELNR